MQQGAHIAFQVHYIDHDGVHGDIQVSVDQVTLMRASDYPLTILADQLLEWSRRVDDHSACVSFILSLETRPELTGSFRIEPRPTNWQFTSMWELRRHDRLLPLDDFKKMAAQFHDQLNVA